MAVDYTNDWQYAREKLPGSYVVYRGVEIPRSVVRVEDVESQQVYVRRSSGAVITTHLPDLDLEPPRLGYVNQQRMGIYTSRMPARHYRQGFREQTLRGVSAAGRVRRVVVDRSFDLAIRDMYPKIHLCVENIENGEVLSKAFSRDFAVLMRKSELQLEYKGRIVGNVNSQNASVTLNNKFMYLEEVLEKCLH